jgi:hypothetical protein
MAAGRGVWARNPAGPVLEMTVIRIKAVPAAGVIRHSQTAGVRAAVEKGFSGR